MVFSYADNDQFQNLWESVASLSKLVDLCRRPNLVVVWDGVPKRPNPSDSVDIQKYITPIDWAVAISLSAVEKLKGSGYPDLKFFIVDSGILSASNSVAARYVEQLSKRDMLAMPWVRIFGPGDTSKVWGFENLLLNLASAGLYVDAPDPQQIVPSMRQVLNRAKPDLDLIKGIWAANLTRTSTPDDHHAIANIAGPLLLMKGDDSDLQVSAIQRLMQQLELMPKEEITESVLKDHTTPWVSRSSDSWKAALVVVTKYGDRKLQLILLDDMWEEAGWGKMLCWAFGEKCEGAGAVGNDLVTLNEPANNFIIKACKSPDLILDRFVSQDSKVPEDVELDQRFRLRIDLKEENTVEILFLDLRLFSGKPLSEEMKFFRRALELAKRFVDRKGLPWQGIGQEEISRVRAWLDRKNQERKDPEYGDALTLFPRLLALIDFSLPIVLFSSTGRRDILSKLLPYKNIITSFDKPKFTIDIPLDVATQTKRKMEDAVRQALDILQLRLSVLDRLVPDDCFERPTSDDSKRFVRLYIDESGRPNDGVMTVGGLLAIAESEAHFDRLNTRMIDRSLGWGDHGTLTKLPVDTYGEYAEPARKILATAGECGVELYGVALSGYAEEPFEKESSDALLSNVNIDNLHRNLLRALVETVTSFLGPLRYADNRKWFLSVLPEVRSPKPSDLPGGEKAIQHFRDRYGLKLDDRSRGGRILKLLSDVIVREEEVGDFPILYKPPSSEADERDSFKQTKLSEVLRSLTEIDRLKPYPDGPRFYLLDTKDVYPIIASIEQEYRNANLKCTIREAKALMEHESKHQLLNLADWFVRLLHLGLNQEWVEQLVASDYGFGTDFSPSLSDLLRVNRLLLEGAISEAVSVFLAISPPLGDNKKTLEKRFFQHIGKSISTLPATPFFEAIGKSKLIENKDRYVYKVTEVDSRNGQATLKKDDVLLSVPLTVWLRSDSKVPKPPLVGDEIAITIYRDEHGGVNVSSMALVRAADLGGPRWRFYESGLKGIVLKKTPGGMPIIEGPKALGRMRGIKLIDRRNDFEIHDQVSFTFRPGRDKNGKSPWTFVAVNAKKML